MRIRGHDIGVCSWSLGARDTHDLIARVNQLKLQHVQVTLAPLIDDSASIERLAQSGLSLIAGMISFPGEDYSTIALIRKTGGLRPDDFWPQRKELALRAADVAAALKITQISLHAGFIPPSSDAAYETMLGRICEIADPLRERGIDLLLETGQEGASELLQFLNDLRCKTVYVNFDPANLILYGTGDPVEATGILGRHIRLVHVKDANLSKQPRTDWGEEVPFGAGQVPPQEFLEALERISYRAPLIVERESGTDRMRDIQAAIETLRSLDVFSSPLPQREPSEL